MNKEARTPIQVEEEKLRNSIQEVETKINEKQQQLQQLDYEIIELSKQRERYVGGLMTIENLKQKNDGK